ncbi:papain-like cysteine protease family protein [Streptomyces sp. NPDC046925]|uniref:papain-like cysteine protease family protein n=1 Tax=Streptomyces sp. NPDC046925 TaxID=3155375 RepID=UPI0033E4F814
MRHRSSRYSRRRRLSALTLVVAALVAAPAATATAVPDSSPSASVRGLDADAASIRGTEADAPSLLAAKRLNITMQAQQKTNWCWAAAGNTIATFYGRNYSQNQFCNAAFGRSQSSECPNSQATLGDVQNGLDWAGINPGSYVSGWLRYPTVQAEINAGRPVETRIQWSNGGGHMHVLYGYDDASSWVYWGDPWPSSDRYNWASHSWYVNNNTFSWTHSLYRIGA